MSAQAPHSPRENLRGIGLMVMAMIGFTMSDSLIKATSQDLPVGQILILLGIFGGVVFAAITRARGHRVFARDFFQSAVLLRNISEIFGTICYVTALSLIDLSTASAILQATPLAVTLGAVLLLGEKVQWRRWSAIIIGFMGVLIIIRPTGDSFELASIWAVAGLVGLAMRDLATRMIPKSVPTERISTYGMIMLLPAGFMLLGFGAPVQPMSLFNWGQIVALVVVAVLGYWAVTAAMRIGDVSVVAPFRYLRILFALIAGALVFGERPDAWTLIGVAITIAAGLYAFLREQRKI